MRKMIPIIFGMRDLIALFMFKSGNATGLLPMAQAVVILGLFVLHSHPGNDQANRRHIPPSVRDRRSDFV
jgi:hypothetical protein